MHLSNATGWNVIIDNLIRLFTDDRMLSVVIYLRVIADEQKIGIKAISSVYHTRIMFPICC